jgi:hypothetical protein
MTGQIHWQTAQAMRDERLRAAARRRLHAASRRSTAGRDELAAHERQRARVRASLLMTRREDRPADRRGAIGG